MTSARPKIIKSAVLACVALTVPASADVMIVKSSGPSALRYPVGMKLPNDYRLTLKPTDRVVILERDGTRTFGGPGSFDNKRRANKMAGARRYAPEEAAAQIKAAAARKAREAREEQATADARDPR